MKVFRNARDRHTLEENERIAHEARMQYERMESESADGGASIDETEDQEEAKETSQKARKKKAH